MTPIHVEREEEREKKKIAKINGKIKSYLDNSQFSALYVNIVSNLN